MQGGGPACCELRSAVLSQPGWGPAATGGAQHPAHRRSMMLANSSARARTPMSAPMDERSRGSAVTVAMVGSRTKWRAIRRPASVGREWQGSAPAGWQACAGGLVHVACRRKPVSHHSPGEAALWSPDRGPTAPRSHLLRLAQSLPHRSPSGRAARAGRPAGRLGQVCWVRIGGVPVYGQRAGHEPHAPA